MLLQRVITALVLLAILLPALFYPSITPFALVVLVFMAAGAWEWGRLNGRGNAAALGLSAVCLALCAGSWWAGWLDRPLPLLWTLGGGLWVACTAWMLRAGVPGWPLIPAPVRIVLGVLALWLAWLAVVQARILGINFLLSVLTLVWVADIFAYFAGRAFGLRFTRNKLAPSISPGKSWEGVYGALVAVAIYAVILSQTELLQSWSLPVWMWVLVAWSLTAVSIVGDLLESWFKRQAGMKDSSQLLPGHGGVLDRIDSLIAVLAVAAALQAYVSAF